METLFNTLHVVAAVFIVGPMAILPMTGLRAIRAGHADQVTSLAKSVKIFSLLSLVVVFFGFALLGVSKPKDHLSIATPWIWISLVAWVAAVLITLFLVVPALRGAGENLRAGDSERTGDSQQARSYPRISIGSGVASLLLVLVVVLMVWRP